MSQSTDFEVYSQLTASIEMKINIARMISHRMKLSTMQNATVMPVYAVAVHCYWHIALHELLGF